MSAAAAMGSFASRQRAAEGHYFNTEGQLAVMRHLEKLVQQGKVDKSLLEAAQRAAEETAASGLPTEVVTKRNEFVYQHKPGLVPAPRFNDKRYMQLGTQVSMGRARWTTDGASIFSVADGKRLASEPAPSATYYENIRARKIQRAALEGPTVAGYRVLPEMTPGRAFMWGTILAVWGTGALIASTARSLDIHSADEAPSRLRTLFAPVAEALEARLAPLRSSMSIGAVAGDAVRQEAAQSEVVKRLRTTLMAHE
ncbi:hypothetical protein ABPG75_003954 [Micractinium tetrahymenae]